MQALDMERSCLRSSHATLSAVGTTENRFAQVTSSVNEIQLVSWHTQQRYKVPKKNSCGTVGFCGLPKWLDRFLL